MAKEPYIEIGPHADSTPADDEKCDIVFETVGEAINELCRKTDASPALTCDLGIIFTCSGRVVKVGCCD